MRLKLADMYIKFSEFRALRANLLLMFREADVFMINDGLYTNLRS